MRTPALLYENMPILAWGLLLANEAIFVIALANQPIILGDFIGVAFVTPLVKIALCRSICHY
jgi:hypothetical protein